MNKAFFLCASLVFFSFVQADPLLVVILMVKNEETVIQKTLEPYVQAGIRSYVIYDTGSIDSTVARARDFFTQHSITQGYIKEEPFIDFAASRNKALEYAQKLFPRATFFLMPDAEWYMSNCAGLIRFCRDHKRDTALVYLIRILNNDLDFYTARLIRAGNDIQFTYPIHELIDERVVRGKVPGDIFFNLQVSSKGLQKTKDRWQKDLTLLLEEQDKNPKNVRILLYLGQTYTCLGEYKKAYECYKKRLEYKGLKREDLYVTYYRMGMVAEKLMKTDSVFTWSCALENYLKAYAHSPERAEPLVRIADYYGRTGDINNCYFYARQASLLSYPVKDILVVEPSLYSYARHDILAQAAFSMGDYSVGWEALKKARSARPDREHLKKLEGKYKERMN